MIEENRLKNIEDKLDDHGSTLHEISETLSKLAVQDEKIRHLEYTNATLWAKYDQLADPQRGILQRIQNHQASCPRSQIKFLWYFTVCIGVSILTAIVALVLK